MLNSELLYRFGFILSNKEDRFGIPENWYSEKILSNLILYKHHECNLQKFNFNNKSIYILGDIFVAHGRGNLKDNLNELSEFDMSALDNLSGRFVLIFINNNNIKFLNDAFGSKALYYYNDVSDNSFILSSHVNLIASHLNLSIDNDILNYKNSVEYQSKGTRFLAGNLTMYKHVYALSPNHYINLNKKVERFWPKKPLVNTNFEDFLILWKEYFLNFVNYCKERGYRPVFGLTGGVDTRAVIAAFNGNTEFYTITWNRGISEDEKKIISELSDYLKITNSWIDVKEIIKSPCFELQREISNINTGFSRTKSSLTAQLSNATTSNDVFIRGLGGEILRGMYNFSHLKSNKEPLDYAEYLYNGYVLNSKNRSRIYDDFTKYSIKNFFKINNYDEISELKFDIGDLIYWEQRMGMWAANQMLESDSAIKSFVGINSRKLYECAYGLPSDIRFSKELLIKLIKFLDPNLANIKFL